MPRAGCSIHGPSSQFLWPWLGAFLLTRVLVGNHRLDHIVCNSNVVERCVSFSQQEVCPWAAIEVSGDLKRALSAEHYFILHELLLGGGGRALRQHRVDRYHAFMDRPCKMM